MDESNNQAKDRHHGDERTTDQELQMLPCDQRYRTSKYFLEDQLRCSEAAADLRSVRALFSQSSFSLSSPFQFQTQAVPVRVDEQNPQQRR